MKFDRQLFEGTLVKRYKRFFADVKIGDKIVIAHVPNSGSMKGCNLPDSPCRVTYIDDPNRKLKYTLEMVRTSDAWIGVNTAKTNLLVHELWENKVFSNWEKFDRIQREVKISEESRIDFVLWSSKKIKQDKLEKPNFKKLKGPFHFVEVKNVSMAENGVALFPDSVTLRGQKHIDELIKLKKMGHTSELVFVIQREDCSKFAPADSIDPVYGKKLRAAIQAGVTVTALACKLDSTSITLHHLPLEICLN